MPIVAVNYLAVLACGVFSLALGFLWYGPLFGKKYMAYIGTTPEDIERFKADPKARMQMNINYGLTFVVALISAFILDHVLIYSASYLSLGGTIAGLQAGFWCWLGFAMPAVIGGVFWEGKKWGWFVLVAGYYLVQLMAMGVILALWV